MSIKRKKVQARLKRKARIRKKINGTAERLRLTVFRSNKHIYAQLVNDTDGRTLVAASSLEKETAEQLDTLISENEKIKKNKAGTAWAVGTLIAKRALSKGIENVVFDRNGFLYHGRIKAVSDGARSGGLKL